MIARWGPAFRIARRDAWRSRGRSLLVIVLIGLPVFALGVADVFYRSYQLDPGERVQREIGAATAGVQWFGRPVQQTPAGWLGPFATVASTTAKTPPAPSTRTVLTHLPAGSRAIEQLTEFSTSVQLPDRIKLADLIGLDYRDPIAAPLVRQVSGRAPQSPDEAVLTPALARSTGLHVGDTLHDGQASPSNAAVQDFRIVGIAANTAHRDAETIYTLPSALATKSSGLTGTWLLSTPGPVSFAQTLALNKAGYLVLSRAAYLDPPPRSQWTYTYPTGEAVSTQAVATGALVAGMALLEIVLLAGPSFAVSARRQRRTLGLLAATGGRPRDLRNVVLAQGVVLGGIAGVVSAIGGIGVGALGLATLGQRGDRVAGHVDIRALELLALVLLALVTALAAAVFPARAAARTDVVAVLAGRRGQLRTRKRVPLAGLVVAGVGIAVALGAATATTSAAVILAGVALTEVGLIMCTPTVLGLVAALGRRLPLAPRIALRDAGRNRSAAAPAVAAVMASVIGAVALVIAVSSNVDLDRRSYVPRFATNEAAVSLAQPKQADAVVQALRSTLPRSQVVAISAVTDNCDWTTTCVQHELESVPDVQSARSRYRGGGLAAVVVDDGTALSAVLGTPSPTGVAALRAGRAVVTDPSLLRNGQTQLTLSTTTFDPSKPGGVAPSDRKISVPAIAVTDGFAGAAVIVPPSFATELDLPVSVTGILAYGGQAPSDREQQLVRGALAKIDPNLSLSVETGYHDPDAWLDYGLVGIAVLIAVGAAVIATALANVDGRPDLVTLGAVGASPRTRRLLSMSRAGVIATIGAVIGVAAGFVPAFAWVHSQQQPSPSSYSSGGVVYSGSQSTDLLPSIRFVVPWLPVIVTLVAIPALAAVIAGLFSRSRLPSERPAV